MRGPVLGRAPAGRADHAGCSPRSGRATLRNEIRLRVRFGGPSRIRTCAHGSGVHFRVLLSPAETWPGLLRWGAYGTPRWSGQWPTRASAARPLPRPRRARACGPPPMEDVPQLASCSGCDLVVDRTFVVVTHHRPDPVSSHGVSRAAIASVSRGQPSAWPCSSSAGPLLGPRSLTVARQAGQVHANVRP